jgi:PEP-CTERM motif
MKKTILVLLSAIGAAGLASVQAQLFNVNFTDGNINAAYGGGDATPAPPGAVMTGAAVLGSAGDIWNGLGGLTYAAPGGAASASGRPLVYNNGWASPVTLSLSAPSGTYGANSVAWNNYSTFSWASLANEQTLTGGPATAYSALYSHTLVANSAAGNGNVTLTGLTPGTYNLVLYSGSDLNVGAGRTGTFVVNGVTQTTLWTASGATTLIPGVDYTEFTGVTTTGILTINLGNLGGSETDLNGFQLQFESSVVPEPGTLALLASGAVLLLGYQRRKALRA